MKSSALQGKLTRILHFLTPKLQLIILDRLNSALFKMTLLEEIDEYFGTKNLYEVINADKDASEAQIKKAYRKSSLKVHPDRAPEQEKEKATKRFQALAQVHYVLSDPERRKLYDEQGVIANEDNLESEADWSNYWRLLFPKISENDIQSFLEKYVGSDEEEQDLIAIYNRFEGDLDKISETHIGYDEQRTTDQLKRLIEEKKIEEYSKFTDESDVKKTRRVKRAEREARKADKLKKELKDGEKTDSLNDLAALIRGRSQNNFESMISSLEAKYSNGDKGVKRKRNNR